MQEFFSMRLLRLHLRALQKAPKPSQAGSKQASERLREREVKVFLGSPFFILLLIEKEQEKEEEDKARYLSCSNCYPESSGQLWGCRGRS